MKDRVFVGYFESEEGILAATRAARDKGYRVQDVYTPYAVHGLDEAMGLRPSRLTWVCFFAGLLGLTGAVLLQCYASAVSWPLNVGGKPFNSFPAFVPVAFELTVLFGGLFTVAALFVHAKLRPRIGEVALPGVTNDRFALALAAEGTLFDPREAEAFLRSLGAAETEFTEVAS